MDAAADAYLRHAPTTLQHPPRTRPQPSAGTPLLHLKLACDMAWPPSTTSTSKAPAVSESSRYSPLPRASAERCALRCAPDSASLFTRMAPKTQRVAGNSFVSPRECCCIARQGSPASRRQNSTDGANRSAPVTGRIFCVNPPTRRLRKRAHVEPSLPRRRGRAVPLPSFASGSCPQQGTPSPPSHSLPVPVARSRSCAIRRGAPPHRTPPYLSTSSNTPPLKRARSPCRTSFTACAAPAVAPLLGPRE